MAKERSGTIAYDDSKKCYRIRLTLNDGSRPWVDLSPTARSARAEERARAVAAERSKIAREKNLTAADFGLKRRAEPKRQAASSPTDAMQEWLGIWTAHRQRRGLSTALEVRRVYELHILPVIGSHVRDWTRDDFRRLSRRLDERVQAHELTWKSARNFWVVATKMVADAAGSKLDELRVRDDNPAVGVEGPDRGARKAKQFLYPSEFLTLAACPAVPLDARRAVAIAIYTYLRDGELRALRWDGGDIDLEHGVLSVTKALRHRTVKPTKSGETRRFAIEAALLPLLQTMRAEAGHEGPVLRLREDHMAELLRKWLHIAGVRRPELHKGSPTRKPLTWHDLRATGATWMAVRGDDPLKIKQRCGHATFSTTELYIREAEAVRDGFGEVFPPLPEALVSGSESSGESSGSGGAGAKPAFSSLRGQDLNLRPSGYESTKALFRLAS
ncbi:MAG: tyrosine-type recombinase/integrase [Polyangiaceae bacterium]